MNLQIGTILIAKEDQYTDDTGEKCLIKDGEYTVNKIGNQYFEIESELFDVHEWDIDDLDEYFTIKRYTLQDLKTRTDLMVRIDSEEQAKKFGDEWTNIRYFKSKEYYGYIENHKDIAFLTADEKQNRTLVPFDLIDFGVEEEAKETSFTWQVMEADFANAKEEIVRLKGELEKSQEAGQSIAQMLNDEMKEKVAHMNEIIRLKRENDKKTEVIEYWQQSHRELSIRYDKLRESRQITPDLEKRERMAWEYLMKSVNNKDDRTACIGVDDAFILVDQFLAKSKEVKDGE